MCGIAGIVGLADLSDAERRIRRMSDAMSHRGPDAEGLMVKDKIAFGHRRLSIIDLSEKANQPMSDTSGRYCIVFNGEIYNYKDVKAELTDYPFATDSDTEAVVAAYAKFGPDCLKKLNGMFAFAIWNNETSEMFVARDRLGVKPLYYAQPSEGVLVFASEIRSILSSGLVKRKLDEHGLYDYLMYQSVYSPRTIVEGISQMPAGEYGRFSNGKFSTKPYWQIDKVEISDEIEDDRVVKARIRELLTRSVEMRLISDVRLGAFLSGGIDSSTIVGLMAEVSEQPVETFSVAFAEKEFDESPYAELIAKKFRTRHTSVLLRPEDFLAELPNALAAIDSPSGDGLNTFVVSKLTRESGIKVALSGLGGDELFAGYPNFLRWKGTQTGLLKKLPPVIRRSAASLLGVSGNSKYRRLADMLDSEKMDLAGVYPATRQVMSRKNVEEYCFGGHRENTVRGMIEERADQIAQFPLLSQFSIAELLGYTKDVLLKDTDQFSMASSLEVREPFFDYRLVEYVLHIPDRLKHPRHPKSLLVESVAPLLPDEIVHRKKMGFALPWEKWMRNELNEFCRDRIDSLAERSVVDPDALLGNWRDFNTASNGVAWSQLWHLVVLADWLKKNEF